MSAPICRSCEHDCDHGPDACGMRDKSVELDAVERLWAEFLAGLNVTLHPYLKVMLAKAVAEVIHRQADYDAIDAFDARGLEGTR